MTDVEQGGDTVFPYINASVPPQRGAALFWHNFHEDGHPDYSTRHAACPVVVGNKWGMKQ